MPMDALHVEAVDERDSHWELRGPRFRIYLQTEPGPDTSASTATFDITNGDVRDVIEWAQKRVAGTELRYAIALVHDDAARESENPGHGRGLVWLVGHDLNDEPLF